MRYGVRPNCLAGFEFSLFSFAVGKRVLRLCRGKGVDDVSGVRMHVECLAGLEYNPYHPDTIIVEHHPAILRCDFHHVLSPQERRPDKRREHTQARGKRFGFHTLYSFPFRWNKNTPARPTKTTSSQSHINASHLPNSLIRKPACAMFSIS